MAQAAWHGFPDGTASCRATALSPASLYMPDWFVEEPARCGEGHRHPVVTLLIQHEPTGRLALFDLGLNSSWRDSVPPAELPGYDLFDVKVEVDLVDVLAAKGIKADDISTVILSHHHFDHVGDARQFASSQIIVGPDTKHKIRSLDKLDNVLELSWGKPSPRLATFDHSYDVWNDGSLVLVDAPGHTSGHLAALIRTGSDEYVLAAADCCHHPRLLAPKPDEVHYRLGKWREAGEPQDEPPQHSNYDDYALAEHTLERVKAADERDDVMVVLAHDFSQWEAWGKDKMVREGVELNGWRDKKLKVSR